MQAFPHSNDASDKIWLQSAPWSIFMFEIVNGHTHTRTPARVLSYKLTLWAFGSGELKLQVPLFFILIPHVKFQDHMSYRSWLYEKWRTDRPKPICLLNFFKAGSIKIWISQKLLSQNLDIPKIAISKFGYPKDCYLKIWISQKLLSQNLDIPKIAISKFGQCDFTIQ